jgi:hypothetical protein
LLSIIGREFGVYYDTFTPDEIPSAPPDPALANVHVAQQPFGGFSYVSGVSYDAANPAPDWIDLKPLDKALTSGECKAAKELPASFAANFHSMVMKRAERNEVEIKEPKVE